MSAWVDGKIVRWPDEPIAEHPGWVMRDCGCCNGIEWGGSEPRECSDCAAGGLVAVHLASGTMALYPGGPLRGRVAPATPKEGT